MAEVNNKESNLDKRITDAMHRIEELYNETDGKCYVSFSGGKDSTVLLALIKMCEDILTIPKDSIPAKKKRKIKCHLHASMQQYSGLLISNE